MTERSVKVLLIEDDPDDTLLMMESLADSKWPDLSFVLTSASTLEEGLRLLSDEGAELVLLDLMLPGISGLDGFRAVRERAPLAAIVVLTGLKDEALGLEAIGLGAQDYLIKGTADDRLLKRAVLYAVERARLVSRLQAVLDAAADAMVVVDGAGTVRYANPAAEALFGRKAAELAGRPLGHPLPPRKRGELRLQAADGSERTAEVRVTDIDWQGAPARHVSARDVTDLLRVEQLRAEVRERQRLDELKDNLLHQVSHQLRTPLTVVKGVLDSLHSGAAGSLSPDQADILDLARRSVLRLMRGLESLVELHRLESGRALVEAVPLDACELLREAVRAFESAGTRGKRLEARLNADLPKARADEELFRRTLDNLIDNALRCARSTVFVEARVVASRSAPVGPPGGALLGERFIEVSVLDDGPGIPPEDLPRLFEKFVQIVRPKQQPGYRGTGLGLALCKEMAASMGGRVWAENLPGGGAAFRFVLPI